ncbi:acyl-CoA thioesterase [Castellaniella sp.]|uniref:acyl-CoA thioesterase n=1 Tax=Castellaniella sp. TaxID=1955812 RepID=UPI003567D910
MTTSNADHAPYDKAFEITMDVRWGDLDSMRHVNNAMYFRYFEESRVRLFESLGRNTSQEGFAVLAHVSCDFLEPLMYPACITVGMKCLRIGRSSLRLQSWIARADDPDILYARGESVVVNADDAGHPIPWSDADRAALQQCFVA